MKINCNIADDLMPLYVDEVCSADSRAAIEEHLKNCENCRKKYGRMSAEDIIPDISSETCTPELAGVARRIKRRRVRTAVIVSVLVVVIAIILAAVFVAVISMYNLANPTVYEMENGTINLTAGDLEVPAAEAFDHVLFTNFAQIEVKVESDKPFSGRVMLWNAEYDEYIMVSDIDNKNDTVTFTGLSSAYRYKVSCEGLSGATLIISEGRVPDFFNSLKSVVLAIIE